MKRSTLIPSLVLALVVAMALGVFFFGRSQRVGTIRLAISPYQDLAMIVAKEDVLDKEQADKIQLVTLPWEEILPSVASAGDTVDVGFGSLVEFLTKYPKLNAEAADPVLFIYPAYVFKGGVFITFNDAIPELTKADLDNPEKIKKFLSYRIGAQKNSIYEMMLFSLAKRAGLSLRDLKIFDTPLNDGILATQGGSLDIASAGLTQRTEAAKRGGRVVLSMETLGFADITGFICKRSTLQKKETEIRSVIETWFKSVDFVLADLDKNSRRPLAYLKKNAATQYTIEGYKAALNEEYFPRTLQEVEANLVSAQGTFGQPRISRDVSEYLVQMGLAKETPPPPEPLTWPKANGQ